MSDPVDTTGRAWAAPPSTALAASHTSPCVCVPTSGRTSSTGCSKSWRRSKPAAASRIPSWSRTMMSSSPRVRRWE